MSQQLLPGYLIRAGSGLDRALLVKFMQRTYQDVFPNQDFSHLARTVDQYYSPETPLWWVEEEGRSGGVGEKIMHDQGKILNIEYSSLPLSPPPPLPLSPIACLWAGNAIDQVYGDRHVHIFILYVVLEHRRLGIGTALMRYVEDWARVRGDRQIGLQVFQANAPAINLYNRLGYQPQSIWMVKNLQQQS